MDRVERVRYIADFDRHVRESRSEHLALLEELEDGSGLNLDVYAAIYGKNALDGMDENAVKLRQNWAEFLAALNSDQRYTTVIYPCKIQIPGCHGTAAPGYKNVINMVIVDGAAEVLVVNGSEAEASYVVQGNRILYWHDGELVTQTTVQLAGTSDDRISQETEGSNSSRILGIDSKIIVTDDIGSLRDKLSDVLDRPQNSNIFSTDPYFAINAALREYDDESLAQKELV